MSSKSILIILSYTVSKLTRFFETQYITIIPLTCSHDQRGAVDRSKTK